MKIKTFTLLLAASIVFSCAFYIYTGKRVIIFSCLSHADKYYKSGSVHTDFQIITYNDDTGFIAYKGILLQNTNEYIVNRELKFSIDYGHEDGIIILKTIGVEKKPNDTVPDEHAWNKNFKSGIRYYTSLLKTKNDDIFIVEKGVPIYVCS